MNLWMMFGGSGLGIYFLLIEFLMMLCKCFFYMCDLLRVLYIVYYIIKFVVLGFKSFKLIIWSVLICNI